VLYPQGPSDHHGSPCSHSLAASARHSSPKLARISSTATAGASNGSADVGWPSSSAVAKPAMPRAATVAKVR